MPLGVTFWYHSQKSMSSRFNVLSGSYLIAGGHACNISYTFTKFLTNHQKTWNQIYFINGVLSDRYEGYSKRYSCLSKTMVTCMHVTNTILSVYN